MPATRERIKFDGERVVLIEEESPSPQPDEVSIRTEFTQVSIGTECASIERAAETGEESDLGYSHVGVVDEVGENVDPDLLGRRMLTLAHHASHITIDPDSPRVIPVPDGVEPHEATLGILGSVAYHIVERANPRLLEPSAVLGQGTVGSIVTQLVARSGARPIIAFDLRSDRLEKAREVGAHAGFNPTNVDAEAAVKELLDGDGVSLCIEAAASPEAYRTAIDVLGLRGRLVVSSAVYDPVEFHVNEDIVRSELTIIGAHQPKCPVQENPYYPWTQRENRLATLEDIRDGRLEVDHLITHRVSPEECSDVYDRLRDGDRSIVGVFFEW